MGIWRLLSQGIGRKPLLKQQKTRWVQGDSRKLIYHHFYFLPFLVFLMTMELVGKLRFLNEDGELDTVNPGERAEALTGTAVGAVGAGLV